MAENNLFEELKESLDDFESFLDDNVSTIKPAIQQLASLIPQINDLIDSLSSLMGSLKTEIENLDVSSIPGLSEVSGMTEKVTTMLTSAKNLLPDQSGAIDEVLGIANVVTGLPSLDDIKNEIVSLINAIVVHLNGLKSA